MHFIVLAMAKALSLLWKLTDLRGWCEAMKPRLIVVQKHQMLSLHSIEDQKKSSLKFEVVLFSNLIEDLQKKKGFHPDSVPYLAEI